MAEDQPELDDLDIDKGIEVSDPLEFRRLHGNARCSQCKDLNQDCLLERKPGNLHCLTCKSTQECHFRRLVVKEGPATTFSWEELIGSEVGSTNKIASAAFTGPSRKRPYSAIAGDGPSQLSVNTMQPPFAPQPYISSVTSEPASQIRTHVSTSPFTNRKAPMNAYQQAYEQDMAGQGLLLGQEWLQEAQLELMDPFFFGGPSSLHERQNLVKNSMNKIMELELDPDPGYSSFQPSRPSGEFNLQPPPMPTPVARPNQQKYIPASMESPSSFRCPTCKEDLNTRSELRKHMARHEKPHHCDVPDCPRAVDGFATRNDLERHQTSVHSLGTASTIYKCAVPDCKDRNKEWSRKDNFKAHLKRMHSNIDVEEYLRRSRISADPSADK